MASHPATTAQLSGRVALVRRGRQLAWFTIGWNALEGLVAITSGLAAASIALPSFGADAYVEVFAGSVVLWRLAAERRGQEVSEAAERRAVRLIAGTFFVLAAGVAAESTRTLLLRERPQESLPGIVLAVVSLVVMPRWPGPSVASAASSTAERSRPTRPRRPCACGCRPSCWPGWASTPRWAGGGPPAGRLRGRLRRRARGHRELAGRDSRRLLLSRRMRRRRWL
jgi:hypothetical protein